MAEHGCTYVVHCFTETDLLYYRDTMAEVIKTTHDAGLESWVDPWGVSGIFSGETLSRFVIDHPEAHQVLSDGRLAPGACPNHPATRQFLIDWVDAAAHAGARVAFWDEPHFDIPMWRRDTSGAWACRCEHCQERFRQMASRALPELMDDEVRSFREASLIDLLAELSMHARKLGMRSALCLLPADFEAVGFGEMQQRMSERWQRFVEQAGGHPHDDEPWKSFGIRDWDAAASIADLDIFGCDPYWYAFRTEPEPFVRALTRRTAETARRNERDVQIWVQAFNVPEGREEELDLGLRVAVEEGATHVAAWSFRGTESMSSIRCAQPEVVWEVLGRSFRALREGTSM
jgi:hypothetical protein